MMLVLAVRSDPERVYQRALRYFTPAELAEAFAATRGVASPTQLRAFMKRDPRDLLGAFRALAPPRKPIVLQRWSIRRVGLAAGGARGIALLPSMVGGQAFFPAENIGAHPPQCGTGHSMILAAQAVPSAALVPCVAELPSGWQVGGADIASGHARFWLDSDQAGARAVTITLSAACDVSGAQADPVRPAGHAAVRAPAEPGARSSPACASTPSPAAAPPTGSTSRPARPRSWPTAVDSAVGFMPRARLVDYVRDTEGLALCGRGAPCPG